MKSLQFTLLAGFLTTGIHAALVEKSVTYDQGGVELEGFHVYDDAVSGKRPGVLVVHQWTGLSEMEKRRSRQLAELGYNVFAADIYGKGVRPQGAEAGKTSGTYKSDRTLFRARLNAALTVLKTDERTEPAKIAAIGYCFGGAGVLELARAGTEIAGVVSFHGALDAQTGMLAEKGKIPAKVLVLHGAIDPYVPPEQVTGFQKEMNEASADYQFVTYSGAVHSFTHPEAGDDPSKGAAYNQTADRRSWAAMRAFFNDLFN